MKFTQAANYIKTMPDTDVDLLQLTNEIIEGWEQNISTQQKQNLQNTILINLTALKQY